MISKDIIMTPEGSHTTSSEQDKLSDLHENNGNFDNTLSQASKKSIQKRKKYRRIDDEIRLKLVEAVEKNGEMLKTAASRYNVNYSSAKSIFHTYRKEGRVMKKSIRERYKKKPQEAQNTSSNSQNLMMNSSNQQQNILPIFQNSQKLAQVQQFQPTSIQTPFSFSPTNSNNVSALSNFQQPQVQQNNNALLMALLNKQKQQQQLAAQQNQVQQLFNAVQQLKQNNQIANTQQNIPLFMQNSTTTTIQQQQQQQQQFPMNQPMMALLNNIQ